MIKPVVHTCIQLNNYRKIENKKAHIKTNSEVSLHTTMYHITYIFKKKITN